MTLTVGSLFSGIGGLDLGLERAGMKVIWQSEIDPYACRVLSKHWPEVVNHGNIKEINWQEIERPNVICGGYPCQPFSTAGRRLGEEDPRHLWPWVREAISQLRPDYAILENVRGHLSLGGLSVVGELTALGYDCEWRVVSAASVGANHRRDRVIIVAYPHDARSGTSSGGTNQDRQTQKQKRKNEPQFRTGGLCPNVANADSEQLNGRGHGNSERTTTKRQTLQVTTDRSSSDGHMANTISDRWWGDRSLEQNRENVYGWADQLRGENGFTGWSWWETEPDVGRVAHGVPSRVDRLRGLGNAVVPQVAEVIGRMVIAHHQQLMA